MLFVGVAVGMRLRLQVRSKLFGDLLLSVIDFNIVEVCVCEPSVHCRFALCIQASSFDIRAFIGQVWLVIVFGDMKRVTFELGGKSPMIVWVVWWCRLTLGKLQVQFF